MKIDHLLLVALLIISCSEVKNQFELPVYGQPKVVERSVDGQVTYDTISHTISDFTFVNQDSAVITNEHLDGNIYVADFFFTSCPTICPVMKTQLVRVYEKFREDPNVMLVSYTIDPEFDTVALLNDYASRLGASSEKWHFLTGDMDEIYELAESSYMVVADEDDQAPGGFIHSGAFILVDKERQVRGVYDGTEEVQVDILMKDIQWLLDQENEN